MNESAVIREARAEELQQVLALYLHLHEASVPPRDEKLERAWEAILADGNHHLIVSEADQKIVSSCVCVVVPNLTRGVRPYALIENVVTHPAYRGKGLATRCLHFAREIAEKENCYKIMLLTGAKDEKTLDFYRRAGFNSSDKTAFIQWL